MLLSILYMIFPKISAAEIDYKVIEHITIYEKRDEYCAWPAVARTDNGDIVVLYTRSEEHLGPDGQILLSRSTDNGRTWEDPVVVYDTPLDDRESGITALRDGRLLAHYHSVFWKPTNYAKLSPSAYEQETLNRWIVHVDSPAYRAAETRAGSWHAVSDDGGHTWSQPVPGADSVHGGIQLHNGDILVAAYRKERNHVGVYRAANPLGVFDKISTVFSPEPETTRFGEPHILQLASGRVVMFIRATAIPYDDGAPHLFAWSSYSDDNGSTWAEPFRTPYWGFPPHLLQLSDGRVVVTYGHRRPPYGQRAAVSDDGVTWLPENEFILRDDAPNTDLGYPVSIELDPGRILTIYYQPNVPPGTSPRMNPPDPNRVKPGIHGTIWELK